MRKACLRNRNLSYVNTYNRPEGGSRDRTFSNYPFGSNILCCLLWAHLTSKCVPEFLQPVASVLFTSAWQLCHIILCSLILKNAFNSLRHVLAQKTPFFMYTLVLHCLLSSCNIGQFILPVLLCKFAACLVLPLSLQLKSQSSLCAHGPKSVFPFITE